VAQYSYNAFGERIKKVAYNGDRTSVTYFFYDGAKLTAEADGDGKIIKQYVYVEDRPAAVLVDREIYALHSDWRGAPLALTDENQHVVWRAEVGLWHEATITRAKFELNLRGSNQYFDAESGLHYNYHRYFDPQVGRYLTPDPIGQAGGLNLYAFVEGNPVAFVDSKGTTLEPADAVPAPWIFGTRVHTYFSAVLRSRGRGWGGNDGRGGTWSALRPDGYYVDPINMAAERANRDFAGELWELKPISWASGPNRAAALAQVATYISSAQRGCWVAGSAARLGVIPPTTLYHAGRFWLVDFEADTAGAATGLVFYSQTRTTDPQPETVPVPAGEPQRVRERPIQNRLEQLKEVLQAVGMALLEILKWIAIIAAVIIAALAIIALSAKAAAVAAVVAAIVFSINLIRGGGSRDEALYALSGRRPEA
jgi:RHS repeat-associated protein